ncbi:MAG: response regulator, partial [Rhodoferax sp.]|nr:response regulator [Rhodoferax sp.]
SNLARALEHALQHVQLHRQGTPEHAGVFVDAPEDIRRLLHQFAAGFLKEPNADIVQSLHDIIETEFAAPELDQLSDEPDLALPERALAAEQVVPASESPSDLELDFDFVAPSEPLAQDATSMPVAPLPAATALAVAVPEASDALPMIDASDDEMDAVDQLDPDLFPIFEEEAADLLPNLGGALREWVARPENVAARSQALRLLHTLKGSSRLAGALRIGEMSHRMESSIEHIGSEDLQTTQIEPLLTRFDTLQASFDRLTQPPQALVLPMGEAVAEGTAAAVVEPSDLSAPVPVPAMPQLRQSGNQSVRVRSQLLERLVNQAGEVMITRSRMDARLGQFRASLDDLDGNLERLRKQLRDVEVQAESQMQSRLAQTKELSHSFDPLEFDRFTRLQELTRMMAESVNDVATVQRNLQRAVEGTEDDLIAQGRQARELQRDLLRTRMVEFEAISERLYGVVRQAAKDTGKQVKLDIVGGSIDIDRGVLERIAPAFEHLLRNAVAHGIESAAVRAAAGKAPVGTIQICVSQASNDVSVEFRDDGGGLPLEKIRAKAVAGGLLAADAVLSDEQAANLVFLPGLSTADQITEVAGRGIGMDVVRSEVLGLGGRIETSTRSGQGAVFKLVLPLTTAVTQVVMLRMGEFTMGVPSNLMETVLRVPATVVEQAYEAQVFDMGVENIPFFWAGSLLQISARSSELHGKTLPVAVFRSAGQRLALHVDEVLGNREVVVKNLGPQLGRLPGLAGISVLASGAVALIYNPVALASVYGEQAQHLRLSSAVANPAAGSGAAGAGSVAAAPLVSEVPLILVVDDSITVRRVTQRLLKREGYRVALAADGLQALERLQDEKPTVVLSDIEMPRMDGFDLARNIRGDANLRDLPIIMITSRIAEKHHQHAKELGVDHYLGKPYSEDELLGLVRDYCAVRA